MSDWLFAQFVLSWPLHRAEIAGIALSTTSVAVVFAVMIEGKQSETALGKTILAACFITDFGTVLAPGTLFAGFNLFLPPRGAVKKRPSNDKKRGEPAPRGSYATLENT